jgi:hypothetical protein
MTVAYLCGFAENDTPDIAPTAGLVCSVTNFDTRRPAYRFHTNTQKDAKKKNSS